MNYDENNSEVNIEDIKFKENYQEYMNRYQVDNDLHQRLLSIPKEATGRKTAKIKQYSRIAASICILLVSGAIIGSLFFFGTSQDHKGSKASIEEGTTDSKAAAEDDSSYNDNFVNNDSPAEAYESTPEAMAVHQDCPVPLSGNKESTYTQFYNTFDKWEDQYESTNSDADEPDADTATIKKTLQKQLPSGLSKKLEKVKESYDTYNNRPSLTITYQSRTKAISGKLLVNVHPTYDFELEQLVSVENVEKYSLNPSDNHTLPDSMTQYNSTLLYPVFTAESLNKHVIASRVYQSGDTLTISFGVYQNGYVITYEAIGVTAKELASLLLSQ